MTSCCRRRADDAGAVVDRSGVLQIVGRSAPRSRGLRRPVFRRLLAAGCRLLRTPPATRVRTADVGVSTRHCRRLHSCRLRRLPAAEAAPATRRDRLEVVRRQPLPLVCAVLWDPSSATTARHRQRTRRSQANRRYCVASSYSTRCCPMVILSAREVAVQNESIGRRLTVGTSAAGCPNTWSLRPREKDK